MSNVYLMIFQTTMPRISQELKDLLQLSFHTKMGDRFIFENHIVIRIYGFEGETYLLPPFLTPRISSLGFIRNRLATDQLHFIGNNKTSTFKLHQKVGLCGKEKKNHQDS